MLSSSCCLGMHGRETRNGMQTGWRTIAPHGHDHSRGRPETAREDFSAMHAASLPGP
jgi:hypothetical protein